LKRSHESFERQKAEVMKNDYRRIYDPCFCRRLLLVSCKCRRKKIKQQAMLTAKPYIRIKIKYIMTDLNKICKTVLDVYLMK